MADMAEGELVCARLSHTQTDLVADTLSPRRTQRKNEFSLARCSDFLRKESQQPLRHPVEIAWKRSRCEPGMSAAVRKIQGHAGRDFAGCGQVTAGQKRVVARMHDQ